MRIAHILPKTDLVFELEKILYMHADILLNLTEEGIIYTKDLKRLCSKSQHIVKQIEKIKPFERKNEKEIRKS